MNAPHYAIPDWFPNEPCWPDSMFEIDVSRERMQALYYDPDEPLRYRQQGFTFRTPRPELFVNDAKVDLMLAVWLIIRPSCSGCWSWSAWAYSWASREMTGESF